MAQSRALRSILLGSRLNAWHGHTPLTLIDIAILYIRLPIAQLTQHIERQAAGTADRCQAIAAIFSGTVAPLVSFFFISFLYFFFFWSKCNKIDVDVKTKQNPQNYHYLQRLHNKKFQSKNLCLNAYL